MEIIEKYKNRIIVQKTIPERKAKYSPFPDRLSEDLIKFLKDSGIKQLYCHQAEMFDRVLDGENVVITTSTASGKTLSFLLPVVQEILNDPKSRAIFIYPTKALASDQFRNLVPLLEYFGKNKIQAGIYDGDTPVNERSKIRSSANIILTNPDMLNTAFLPNHSKFGFNFIFSNLKYVVIDELHTYRGTFGSHVANLFKRLNRICKYYHSSPQFLCSSATIANPVELAENITGKSFTLVDNDGSPAPKKHYYIWQPPFIKKSQYRLNPIQEATKLLPELVVRQNNFIAFCKSRKDVEVVLKESRDKLQNDVSGNVSLSHLIAGYRGGYTPEERKEIEEKMVDGKLKGLVSTNVLELGIDIGKVDTTVIVGYPGTRASFWQQSGRAGRSGNDSSTFLILDNLPFDQYIAINPEWLFDNESESAVIDADNLYIQIAHVRAAAAELPLTLDDIALFSLLDEIVPVLTEAGELRIENGKFSWIGSDFPAGDFSLRNIDKIRYQVINKENEEVITEMDELQAFHEVHKGAIYLHEGMQYIVEKLDLDNRIALVNPIHADYYTVSDERTKIKIIRDLKNYELGRTKKIFGDIKVTEAVVGYKKLQFHNHQNLGYECLEQPLIKSFETEGVRIRLPENVDDVFKQLTPIKVGSTHLEFWKSYYDGMAFALLNATMMKTMTTPEDVGAALLIEDLDEKSCTSICIFDRFIGGIGYAEKAYDFLYEIVKNAIQLVSGCQCDEGCPACVGDYNLDKTIVLWGLENVLTEIAPPEEVKVPDSPPKVTVEKQFEFAELETEWPNFTRFLRESGQYLADFLSRVEKVKVSDKTLNIFLDSEFLRVWSSNEENKKRVKNIIEFYVHVPNDFDVAFKLKDGLSSKLDLDKVLRRYSDLTK